MLRLLDYHPVYLLGCLYFVYLDLVLESLRNDLRDRHGRFFFYALLACLFAQLVGCLRLVAGLYARLVLALTFLIQLVIDNYVV